MKKQHVLTIDMVGKQPAIVARFIARGIEYHASKGRIVIGKDGKVTVTPEGKAHFSAGPRAHSPEELQAMKNCLEKGGKYLSGAEMEKAENWPYPFCLPVKYYAAGRKDSQAQFAALMLGL